MASDKNKPKLFAQQASSEMSDINGGSDLDHERQNSVEIRERILETGTKVTLDHEIHCFLWDSQKDPSYDLWHWHNEVQIIHMIEGEGYTLQLKGEQIALEAPCILLIPGRTMHKIVPGSKGKINHLTFSPSLIELLHFDDALSRIMPSLTEGMMPCTPAIRPCDEGYVSIDMLLTYIESNLGFNDPGRKLQVKGCLMQILGILIQIGYLRLSNYEVPLKTTRNDERMVRLLSFINYNYNKEISVTTAANMMGVSKAYFSRYFKAITGINFVDYINIIRINKAAQDLIYTEDNTDDIAKRNGFTSKSYFFKIFKMHFHTTPYAFRKDRNGFTVYDPKISDSSYVLNPIAGHFVDDGLTIEELGQNLIAEPAPFFPVDVMLDLSSNNSTLNADQPCDPESNATLSYGLVPDLSASNPSESPTEPCAQMSAESSLMSASDESCEMLETALDESGELLDKTEQQDLDAAKVDDQDSHMYIV